VLEQERTSFLEDGDHARLVGFREDMRDVRLRPVDDGADWGVREDKAFLSTRERSCGGHSALIDEPEFLFPKDCRASLELVRTKESLVPAS